VPAPVIDLSQVPPEHLAEAKALLAEYEKLVARNPLHVFEPHTEAQRVFLKATTRIVAAFAGNRFGKTTALIVKCLCQLLSPEDIPEHLLAYRQVDGPAAGWILCPSESKLYDSILPAFDKWCPKHALKGGSRAKAFNGERMEITFANGSTLAFKFYTQDVGVLGGADLDFVGYDEPPPKGHRNECLIRMARGVREWFAMTPVRVNVAWVRREIWAKREDPNITVVRGSIRDNPTLSDEAVEFILGQYDETERESRETGAFMDLAGLVYKHFEDGKVDPMPRRHIHTLEQVWGIDPGIRNAAILAGGFDQQGADWIYDERLIQDGTPSQYAEAIDEMLSAWGLRREHVLFVIDPAARQRSQATGDTVQSELTRLGIYTMNGNRDREAGQQQIRDRLRHGRLRIFSSCVGLRDEADDFTYPLTEPGEPVKPGPADDSTFHRLATLRYQVLTRPFYPQLEEMATERNLGWSPNRAPDMSRWRPAQETPPMGMLS
jgi:hypothetical protein